MTPADPAFARLVSLACHDLRTPLATVNGFAKTLPRLAELDEKVERYVAMIAAAGDQMAELLDDLGLASRIEAGRYEPALRAEDSLALAREAAGRVEEGEVAVAGTGASVRVEPEAAVRAVENLARCAIRHGGVPRLELRVDGTELALAPIAPDAARVVVGEDLRDLGAAVANRVVDALGGSVELAGETLAVRLPRA